MTDKPETIGEADNDAAGEGLETQPFADLIRRLPLRALSPEGRRAHRESARSLQHGLPPVSISNREHGLHG